MRSLTKNVCAAAILGAMLGGGGYAAAWAQALPPDVSAMLDQQVAKGEITPAAAAQIRTAAASGKLSPEAMDALTKLAKLNKAMDILNSGPDSGPTGAPPASSGEVGVSAPPAKPAKPGPVPKAYFGGIEVAKGSGELVKLPRAVANLFIADNTVAEARPASPGTMFVFGKALGETNIVATDEDGNRIAQYTVTVSPSTYVGDSLRAAAAAPGNDVQVEGGQNGIVVNGTVNSAEDADNVMNAAKAVNPAGTVTNNLTVREPVQVELKVRIAQMSRSVTRQLGVNWSSVGSGVIQVGKFALAGTTGSTIGASGSSAPGDLAVAFPGGTFEGVIDALASDNLAHILAEPTLTTMSGTQANFQVGGQYPMLTETNSGTAITATVTFKNYGVLLTFTPTVMSDGRIALQVSPEVSTPDFSNASEVPNGGGGSYVVPSFDVTEASTTVVLGSGQGMAIAGLLQDTTNETDNGVPGLSEVPLLGALFRGDSFTRDQQELVITVTPYVVRPADNPNTIANPDDGWTPANDLQRILLLRDNGINSAKPSIPGDAGFMVQ